MILQDYDAEEAIFQDKRIIDLVGENPRIQQFRSETYDRDYSVFLLESDHRQIVMKRTNDKDEGLGVKLFKTYPNPYVPEVYFLIETEACTWIVMEYIGNGTDDYTKGHLELLVKALAEIHNSYVLNAMVRTSFRHWKPLLDLESFVDQEITYEYAQLMKTSQEILSQCKKTLIHDDMIPLNVIFTNHEIKIIDWEYAMYGPYILDMGRLLSDYNKEDPWVNGAWETDLLERYYLSIGHEFYKMSRRRFNTEYVSARICNYLGIVGSYKRRQASKDAWYELNLRNLLKACDELERLINE